MNNSFCCQVAVCLELKNLETDQELVVATTHLKARQGALLSTLRNEQGKVGSLDIKDECVQP